MDLNEELKFCENLKKIILRVGGEGGGVGLGGGVRVDVIEELKFSGKFTKKIGGGEGRERRGSGEGVGLVGGQGGCRFGGGSGAEGVR